MVHIATGADAAAHSVGDMAAPSVLVLVGPSAVGKTYLAGQLTQQVPGTVTVGTYAGPAEQVPLLVEALAQGCGLAIITLNQRPNVFAAAIAQATGVMPHLGWMIEPDATNDAVDRAAAQASETPGFASWCVLHRCSAAPDQLHLAAASEGATWTDNLALA
jgi:hypothetical protein